MTSRYLSPFPKKIADSQDEIVKCAVEIIMDPAKSIQEQCLAWIVEALILGKQMNLDYTYEEMATIIKDKLNEVRQSS